MADDSQEFKIHIISDADNSGFKSASSAAGELQQSVKGIDEHLPEGSEAWAKYKNILNETSHETLGLHEKHKILHATIRALGPEFAEVGHFASLFFNPMTAGLGAVGIGFTLLYEKLKKVEENAEALAEIDGITKFGKQVQDVGETAGSSLEDLAEKLERIAAAQESIKQKTDASIASIKAETAAAEEVTKAKVKQAEAEIKLRAAAAGWDAARLEAELQKLHGGAEGKSSQLKIDELQKEIDARNAEKAAQTNADIEAPGRVGNAERNYILAQGQANSTKEEIDKLGEQITKSNELLGKHTLSGTDQDNLEAENRLRIIRKAQLEEQYETEKKNADRAKADYDAVSQAATTTAERLKELDKEIANLNAQLALAKSTAGAEASARANEQKADDIRRSIENGGGLQNFVSGAAKTLNMAEHGQKITDAQRQQYVLFEQFMQMLGVSHERMVALLENVIKIPQQLTARVDALQRQVNSMTTIVR